VCDQETSKTRRLKARYWAVENTTTMGCNDRKINNKQLICYINKKTVGMGCEIAIGL
jgi:hypothetical protein